MQTISIWPLCMHPLPLRFIKCERREHVHGRAQTLLKEETCEQTQFTPASCKVTLTRTSSCFSDFIIVFEVSRCSLKSASERLHLGRTREAIRRGAEVLPLTASPKPWQPRRHGYTP